MRIDQVPILSDSLIFYTVRTSQKDTLPTITGYTQMQSNPH